ncbi:MAG: hypothetical protein A3A86_01300 [Elusimicrobia bacterium RIFCSPLOWO2_01_FULL_60_11]|nr:MAG: hypothetical protein A3A86_01300 [Elusimicrobia bacterium RIFCSPLOWO2_01_FULL_60_11]
MKLAAAALILLSAVPALAVDWTPHFYLYRPPPVEKSTSTVFQAVDPQIINKLIELLDERNLGQLESSQDTPLLGDIITFVTPAGVALKNRTTRLGVALSESLGWEEIKHIRVISERNLKERLTLVARWDSSPNVRTIALIALAHLRDKNDIVFFREALQSRNIGIRYATVEALIQWGFPEAVATLKNLAERDESLLIRQYAAYAMVILGDPSGLDRLRNNLDSQDWFVRSLSAKFIGELGDHKDYERLLDRLNMESVGVTNEFINAEIAIGALKLFPQKLAYDKAEKERKKREKRAKLLKENPGLLPSPEDSVIAPSVLELDPLVVTAPRLKIPKGELVDSRVNYQLLKIAQGKEDMRINQDQAERSQAYKDLNFLVTPNGIGLKTRYTVLGYLLTEGLAGTDDFQLQDQLMRIAREGKNADVRCYAIIALAYSKDRLHLSYFQDALRRDFSVADRFAAVEALQIWGYGDAASILSGVVKLDPSPIVRVFAAQALWRMGDPLGRDYMLPFLDHESWLIRAMAMRYFGELGNAEDYSKVLGYFGSVQRPIVQAEMCSALLRLYAKKVADDMKEGGGR